MKSSNRGNALLQKGAQLLYQMGDFDSQDLVLFTVSSLGDKLVARMKGAGESAGESATLTFTAEALQNARAFLEVSQGSARPSDTGSRETIGKPLRKNLPPFLLGRAAFGELSRGSTEVGDETITLVERRTIRAKVAGESLKLRILVARGEEGGETEELLVLDDPSWPVVLKRSWSGECSVELWGAGGTVRVPGEDPPAGRKNGFSTWQPVGGKGMKPKKPKKPKKPMKPKKPKKPSAPAPAPKLAGKDAPETRPARPVPKGWPRTDFAFHDVLVALEKDLLAQRTAKPEVVCKDASATEMAVSGGTVFWYNSAGVYRCTGGRTERVAEGSQFGMAFRAGGGRLYWSRGATKSVGSTGTVTVAAEEGGGSDLAVTGDDLYLLASDSLERVRAGRRTKISVRPRYAKEIVGADGGAYFLDTSGGRLYFVSSKGKSAEQVGPKLVNPASLTVQGGALFWVERPVVLGPLRIHPHALVRLGPDDKRPVKIAWACSFVSLAADEARVFAIMETASEEPRLLLRFDHNGDDVRLLAKGDLKGVAVDGGFAYLKTGKDILRVPVG